MPGIRSNQAAQNAELARYLSKLPPERQQEVLDFARFLAFQGRVATSPGLGWRSVAGTLPEKDARELSKIIEEGCENIDAEGW